AGIADPVCSQTSATDYKCELGREMVVIGRAPEPMKVQSDTCSGDSGGPVYLNPVAGTRYLVAATSRASGPDAKCGPGGIYSLVTPDTVAWLTSDKTHGKCVVTCSSPGYCAPIGSRQACAADGR